MPANGASSGRNEWQQRRKFGHPILSNINLRVPAGSTLAIIGPTGSGKTTLAALVARLWDAPNGELLIDGRPIREWPLETLRRAIGYVPQDTYLFGETLGENIAFGLPKYDAERVREAAEDGEPRRGHRGFHGKIRDRGRGARNYACRADKNSGRRLRARWSGIRGY